MALVPLVAETWLVVPTPVVGDVLVGVANAHGQLVAQGRLGARAALREACQKPLVGKPRRPKVVAALDEATVAELRGVMPGVTVELAPAGDLARGVGQRLFFSALEGPTWGYPNATLAGILALGDLLFAVAPWDVVPPATHLVVTDPERPGHAGLAVLPRAGGFDLFDTVGDGPEVRHLRLALRPPEVLPAPLRDVLRLRAYASSRAPVPLAVAGDRDLAPATAEEARTLVRAGKVLCMLCGTRAHEIASGFPVAVSRDGVDLAFLGR